MGFRADYLETYQSPTRELTLLGRNLRGEVETWRFLRFLAVLLQCFFSVKKGPKVIFFKVPQMAQSSPKHTYWVQFGC